MQFRPAHVHGGCASSFVESKAATSSRDRAAVPGPSLINSFTQQLGTEPLPIATMFTLRPEANARVSS